MTPDELAALVPELDRPVLVAIDGVDGAGKTTYASALAEALDRPCVVVHVDDFHAPRAVRYRRGSDSPEGFFRDTYDLDAFARCVLEPLADGGDRHVLLAVFDHVTNQPVDVEPVNVPADAVVVVEGLFLHRDELHERWDLSVLLDVPFEVSVPRMAARDGTSPDPAHPSMHRYVEGQRLYFAECRPRERATYVVADG